MQKIDKTRSLTPGDDRSRAWKAISLYTGASLSDLVIFDIETTGLSANVSSLYLIGALWYDTPKKEIKMCQWFADDYTSECTILEAFSSFVSGFSTNRRIKEQLRIQSKNSIIHVSLQSF